MSVHYPDGGGCSTWHIDPYIDLFQYNPTANTLIDDEGTLWVRPAPSD